MWGCYRKNVAHNIWQCKSGSQAAEAFYKMCLVLPDVIERIIENAEITIPNDTVIDELKAIANSKNISMAMSIYLLGFSSYMGFDR